MALMGMKIESKLLDKKVAFESIKVGDFFLDGDGDLCVRIDDDCHCVNNAYCFRYAVQSEIGLYDFVTPVDVTITIEGYAS
jgi:hypothetical protein